MWSSARWYGSESRGRMTATRTVVMTGATGGLGGVAAVAILRRAPEVHLVILVRGGADAAAELMRRRSGNANVSGVVADLSSLASVRAAAAGIRGRLDSHELAPLAGLLGNAGLQLVNAATESVDGIELTFAVNVLANYVLIDELGDRLPAGGRVVVTTSDTHFGDFAHNLGLVPGPRWQDPSILAAASSSPAANTAHAGRTAYATSKLAVIYLVHALARHRPDLEVFSFNPGLVPGTGLARDAGPIARFAFRFIVPALAVTPWARRRTVSGGHLADAMLVPRSDASGAYLNGPRVEPSSPESYDPNREEALWETLRHLSSTAHPTPVDESPN
jgi:NAD(P)-dependent dehydrogenase (short-subunit alcohol dehydrogenase family)